MSKLGKWICALGVLAAMLLPPPAVSAQGERGEAGPDKTLSPYFFVKSDDAETDAMPLKSTSAEVDIAGVIADVTVRQVYENEGERTLEAIYVFPASTRAAVYGMTMTVGERTIRAEIQERQKARREYQEAKQAGKSASLLEQQRPNVFQMNVANILPGDRIQVELRYTELLVPTDGVYEFVYPTVVGPRYSSQPSDAAPPSEKWVENPYLHEGERPPYDFDLSVSLAAGVPIGRIACPSHEVAVDYAKPDLARIRLDESEKSGGNRDFILKYALEGGQIQSGLLLYEGEKENFFLLMVQPPERVEAREIPPREYIFIVDVSGSMRGFPLDTSKELLRDLMGRLRPEDRFNVLLFAGASRVFSQESVSASPENVRRALDFIDRQHGGGGTELLPALTRALALPRAEGVSRTVVVATDGYVTVETEAFDCIRENLGKANLFVFGIGSGVNRFLIEGMARAGMGEPFVVTGPQEAPAKAQKFRNYIQSPVLTGIDLDFDDFKVYDVEPPSVPDVLAERPVIVFGKWKGRPGGVIRLTGKTGAKPYEAAMDVEKVQPEQANAALRYLWARHRIAVLSDYNRLRPDEERVKEVTNLGLTYNLLTAYTSFIAVDERVRRKEGEVTTVKQPLPLPQGVSDTAVGQLGVNAPRAMQSLSYSRKLSAATPDAGAPVKAEGRGAAEKKPAMDAEESAKLVENEDKKLKWRLVSDVSMELLVEGKLATTDVQDVAKEHLDGIEKCYEKALEEDSRLQGKLVLDFQVAPDGKVVSVKTLSSQLGHQGLERCVTDQIRKWRFPASAGAGRTTVRITMVFRTQTK